MGKQAYKTASDLNQAESWWLLLPAPVFVQPTLAGGCCEKLFFFLSKGASIGLFLSLAPSSHGSFISSPPRNVSPWASAETQRSQLDLFDSPLFTAPADEGESVCDS